MALAIQAAGLVQQYIWSWLHPTPSKRPDALKLGVVAESYLDPATSQSLPSRPRMPTRNYPLAQVYTTPV